MSCPDSQYQKVLQKAYDFLARREHSRKELFNKLARTCADQALLETVLDTLREEGLQSDERFTESLVHQRINKGQGPVKIRHELHQHGVAEALIEAFLDSTSIDWFALAEAVRIKKYGADIPMDNQKKAKQLRFLYSRGFNSDLIYQLFK